MGDQSIDCQSSELFYNIIIFVFLYWYDVKVYSGLVSLYMHFDIHVHSRETSLSTLRPHAWHRNHVT